MPIFYNTSAPTPGNKNTITDIATNFGIRDFLLTKKLNPRYPQISTNVNGSPRIGEPVLDTVVGNNSNTKPDFSPIEGYSDNIVQDNFGRNTFRPNQDDNPYVNINYIQNINNQQFGDAEWPHGNQEYPRSSTVEIDAYGIVSKTDNAGYRFNNTSKNEYLDVSEQVDASGYLQDKNNSFSKQVNGYLVKISDTEYGDLNLGQSGGVQAANVIGSLLNGQGLGFSDEGLVTNFDLRSSLAGRALGLAGVLNDTELGIIGAQQLAIALGNNAAFNVQQEILGSLNAGENILNLIKEGTSPEFRPNYKITIPGSTLGRIADYTSRILGFTLPKSYLQESGSIFQYENGGFVDNVTRANAMLDNTGKGQIKALITNINASMRGISKDANSPDDPTLTSFRSGYAAGYINDRNIKSNDYNIYAYYKDGILINPLSSSDRTIPDLNIDKKLSKYGFNSPDSIAVGNTSINKGYDNRKISDVNFTWTSFVNGRLNTVAEPIEIPAISTGEYNNKKSLLRKTQLLFNSAGNRNIVSVKGDVELKNSTQISTANGNATSKGSAVLKSGQFDNYAFNGKGGSADDIFCRSWVATNRYDSIGNLIRKSALLRDNMPYRTGKFDPALSVLEDTGFVKIAPYKADFEENTVTGKKANVKNYMFSIENLAWNDNYSDLPIGEQGPGDSTTGRKGRIMWFPPYDINFSESVSVDWEATKFIGRGEPIYTYNNTERTGTLSFSIIVDHPTYANAFKNKNNRPDDNYVATFFAGCCILPDETLTNELIATKIRQKITSTETITQNNSSEQIPQKESIKEEIPMTSFKIYFPNDYPDKANESVAIERILNGGIGSKKQNRYESGFFGQGETNPIDYTNNPYGAKGYPDSKEVDWGGIGNFGGGYTSYTEYTDKSNFGYNGPKKQPLKMDGVDYNGPQDPRFFTNLKDYLTNKCKSCTITIDGSATEQGENIGKEQDSLAKLRATSVEKYLRKIGVVNRIITTETSVAEVIGNTGCKKKTSTDPGTRPDAEVCKQGRYVTVSFDLDPNRASEQVTSPPPPQQEVITKETIKETDGTYNFYNELNFFEKLQSATCDDSQQGTSFIFDSFREKIKYFHPAFHSTTPEGLNSRLTFLHQCTRQGPTSEEQGATNLAFGRAPICILRIGDFFYTKIAIDSLSIDYEPLVWDLNPEGIGVQPMIAKVTLGIKIIGGSSLNGPLNKLQNALSFNYYANTGVYDPRADYIEIDTNGNGTIKNGIKNANDSFQPFSTTDDKFKGGSGSGSDKPLGYNPSNQTQEADKQLNGEVPSQSGTTSEPKITGIQEFLIIDSNAPFTMNISQNFKIKLTSENIFDDGGNFVTGMNFNKLREKIGDINIFIKYQYDDSTDSEFKLIDAPGKKLVVKDDNDIKQIFNNGYTFNLNLNDNNDFITVYRICATVATKNTSINKNLDPDRSIRYERDGKIKIYFNP